MTFGFGRAYPVLLGLWVLGDPSLARAHDTPVPPALEFRFNCPQLNDAAVAEVEARSRVEASLAGRGPMKVHFSCETGGLGVELESLGPELARFNARGDTAGRPLEVALVDLFVQALRAFPDAPALLPEGQSGASEGTAVPGTGDGTAGAAGAALAGAGRGVEAGEAAEPGAEVESELSPAPELRAERPLRAKSRRAEEAGPPPWPWARLYLDATASYESLGSEAVGVLGLDTRVLWGATSRFRMGPLARLGAGLDVPNLSLTALTAGLVFEFSPLEWLSLGIGPHASVHSWRAVEPLPATGTHTLWGANLSGDVLFGSPRLQLKGGLSLYVVPNERIIRVDGTELLHIPPVSIEAHLGGRFGFFLE